MAEKKSSKFSFDKVKLTSSIKSIITKYHREKNSSVAENLPTSSSSEDSPDLRQKIKGLRLNAAAPDLREKINEIHQVAPSVAVPVTKTKRECTMIPSKTVTLIRIRPKRPHNLPITPVPTTVCSSSSPTTQDATLKTPMNRKRCNRCRRYGHINKMCPLNPNNKMLIPPPPEFL